MGCVSQSQPVNPQPVSSGSFQSRNKLKSVDCRRKSTHSISVIIENVQVAQRKLTPQEQIFAADVIRSHILFEGLGEGDIKALCEGIVPASAQQGQYVCKQGDTGNSFFIIKKGRFGVEVNGSHVTTLEPNSSFGEMAMLLKLTRQASVKCLDTVNELLVIKPTEFRQTLKTVKSKQYETCFKVIDCVENFQLLTNKQKVMLANSVEVQIYPAGSNIFEEKQQASSFYVVISGEVEAHVPGFPTTKIQKYQSFGESALRPNGRREGRVTTETGCQLAMLKRDTINTILGNSAIILLYFNVEKWALLNLETFKKETMLTLGQLILASELKMANDGDTICHEKPDCLFIVLDGTINGAKRGTVFGENHLMGKETQLLKLVKEGAGFYSRLSFAKIEKILNEQRQIGRIERKATKRLTANKENSVPIDLSNFHYLQKLGEGQFGEVYLVSNPAFGRGALYALKCLDKTRIREQGMESYVLQERKILETIAFPLIMGYVKSFQDSYNVYILTQYLHGKEMFDVVREIQVLNNDCARFYFGSLLLCIEHLHSKKIIYRDIKPENSVVGADGRVYLIDLGTAKFLNKQNAFKTFTIIGTPHYMAPEVFQGKGYSYEVDMWSLGVILYEFVCGSLPFGENIDVDVDPYKLYPIIKNSKVCYPPFMRNRDCQIVIESLLAKTPFERSVSANIDRIKNMIYFTGFNWLDLAAARMQPPYIPIEFRGKNADKLQNIEGIPLAKQIMKGGKTFIDLTQWDSDLINV